MALLAGKSADSRSHREKRTVGHRRHVRTVGSGPVEADSVRQWRPRQAAAGTPRAREARPTVGGHSGTRPGAPAQQSSRPAVGTGGRCTTGFRGTGLGQFCVDLGKTGPGYVGQAAPAQSTKQRQAGRHRRQARRVRGHTGSGQCVGPLGTGRGRQPARATEAAGGGRRHRPVSDGGQNMKLRGSFRGMDDSPGAGRGPRTGTTRQSPGQADGSGQRRDR